MLSYEDKVRFFSKINIAKSGCWEFKSWKHKKGYGYFAFNKNEMYAHRVSYIIFYNTLIPKGKVILHKCDNTGCVNPDHLSMGTQSDNMKDMALKKRGKNGNSYKTHCSRNHEYSIENTRISKNKRYCKTCDKEKPWKKN